MLVTLAALFNITTAHKQHRSWNYNNLNSFCSTSIAENLLQSPINIKSPFVYEDPSIQFTYEDLEGPVSLFNVDGNVLKMVGDFGQVVYHENQAFAATKVSFHSPSEHTFGKADKQYPLEMQIYH
jgi:carbonic anhydrase